VEPDISIVPDRTCELMVFGAVGVSEAGVTFVDAWTPADASTPYMVVDAGRLVLPDAELNAFKADAEQAGLTVRWYGAWN